MQMQQLTPQQAAAILGSQQSAPLPIQNSTKAQRVFVILSAIISLIVAVLFWTATGLGVKNGITFGIMIVPSLFIFLPAVLMLASVFRPQTNYGLTVTTIVFSSLNSVAAIGIVITFSIYSYFMCENNDYYYYDYYYGYSTGYSKEDGEECASFVLPAVGGALLLISEITHIVLAACEIKRIPRQKQVLFLTGYQPQQMTTYSGQPYMVFSQPAYPNQSINAVFPTQQVYPNTNLAMQPTVTASPVPMQLDHVQPPSYVDMFGQTKTQQV